MSEIFDIIIAVNRLKDHILSLTNRVEKLSDRVDSLSKYPPLVALNGLIEESVAAEYLHLSLVELRRMRSRGEIPFKKFHRKVLYEVDDIRTFLEKSTMQHSSSP
jgi:hypothetical protein